MIMQLMKEKKKEELFIEIAILFLTKGERKNQGENRRKKKKKEKKLGERRRITKRSEVKTERCHLLDDCI